MIIKQLSIFLENKSGRLTEVTELLGEIGVNITALSIADTAEYGILRLIVTDPDAAMRILKANGFSVNLTNVICVSTPNTPGALSKVLKVLSNADISVEYMYAFAMSGKALVIIRTENIDKAIEILQNNKMEMVKSGELYCL